MGRYVSGLSGILLFFITLSSGTGQRITTIQLDGVQYFVSRMNPYSPELNYFLAYQYCRSLGLQLASFETKEKADSITQYLKNAGYDKYDFWTSGNRLGTDMFLWMSTGLPFNATFNYMKKIDDAPDNNSSDLVSGSTSPQRTARESSDSGSSTGCVVLRAPTFEWDIDNCVSIKDFICEQTRCYYYNYGSIPVSTAQGKPKPVTTTTQQTSPSTTESIKDNIVHISNIISRLQAAKKQPVSVILPNKEVDLDQSTNGPYDNFNSHAELQDDPSAGDEGAQENYASTIEPEKLTTIFETNPSKN